MRRAPKHRPLEQRFWLWTMDLLARCGLFGSPEYYWALERAAECVDWSGEEPW